MDDISEKDLTTDEVKTYRVIIQSLNYGGHWTKGDEGDGCREADVATRGNEGTNKNYVSPCS